MIQYLHWYHEDIYGEKRLLKTSKNSNDPYLHTIRRLEDTDLGRNGLDHGPHTIFTSEGQRPSESIDDIWLLLLLARFVKYSTVEADMAFLVQYKVVRYEKL